MSLEEPVSKTKEKKALRDAQRQRKTSKKRKLDEVEEPRDELEQDFIALDSVQDVVGKQTSQSKKRKKDNSVKDHSAQQVNGISPQHPSSISKPKKRKKSKATPTTADETKTDDDTATQSNDAKKPRFILFIGNLPYATTDASLHAHFKKLLPFTLRHRTDRKTKKSKGFAFLEFENFDRMKTCLKLYHHSLFDPMKVDAKDVKDVEVREGSMEVRKGKEKNGARRINVELTAGGGGKAEARKEKIKAKNVKLDEQRKRRLEEERKAKEKERLKKGTTADKEGASKPAERRNKLRKKPSDANIENQDDAAGMHPSRLARLQK